MQNIERYKWIAFDNTLNVSMISVSRLFCTTLDPSYKRATQVTSKWYNTGSRMLTLHVGVSESNSVNQQAIFKVLGVPAINQMVNTALTPNHKSCVYHKCFKIFLPMFHLNCFYFWTMQLQQIPSLG